MYEAIDINLFPLLKQLVIMIYIYLFVCCFVLFLFVCCFIVVF